MTFVLHRLDSCPSSNDAAKALAANGAPEGTVVAAEEQTAGRGTKGRSWHSARGLGLYVSIVLRPSGPDISLLPLAAGLAARDAVESAAGLAAELRWPNDIVWSGKKLGGILCESGFWGNRADYVILGTGLNVNHGEADFPDDVRPAAGSIKMALARTADVDREALLRALLDATGRWSELFSRGPADAIVREFERRSAIRRGDRITVTLGAAPEPAEYRGLDSDGALIVAFPDGVRRLRSADVARVESCVRRVRPEERRDMKHEA